MVSPARTSAVRDVIHSRIDPGTRAAERLHHLSSLTTIVLGTVGSFVGAIIVLLLRLRLGDRRTVRR